MSEYPSEVAKVNAAAAHRRGRSAAHRLGLFVLSAGTVAAAAGCASVSPSVVADPVATNPVAAVHDAAVASSKIHTAKVATTVVITVGGADRRFTGLGSFDFDHQVGAIVLRTPQSPTPLDEIITPATLYLRQPGVDAKWKWVDATKLPDGDLISAGYISPVFDFALLRGVSADAAHGGAGRYDTAHNDTVHYVGQDKVRNTPVTHYSGTLDLTASAQQAQNPIKDELLRASRAFAQKTVPFDAYLDAQGKVRRVVTHFSVPAQAPQRGAVRIAATTDLFDLDQPVTVVTPPAQDLAATRPSPSTAH